ncbi:MAG: hypothetical protein ACKOEQ_15590, partial [Verrucomicrobiota bacterium]
MPQHHPVDWLPLLEQTLRPGRVVTTPTEVERLSKDFYWYSPVLERQLRDKRGDVAVQVRDLDDVRAVLAFAARHGVPVTVRGAGTGN